MKSKPVVKYDSFTFEFCGETVKEKLTRIAVLKAEEAKAVNRTRRDGLCMAYDGTKGKERLEFYKCVTVERKIIEEEKKDD
jgi:hypothetical protein